VVESPSMLYGPESVENAARYRVDKMFFSTGAVSSDGMIASGVYDLMLKEIAKHARRVFYLVDHQKVDADFSVAFGDFNAVDCVISNHDFGENVKARYRQTEFVLAEKGKEKE